MTRKKSKRAQEAKNKKLYTARANMPQGGNEFGTKREQKGMKEKRLRFSPRLWNHP